jgi:hypothetical protein
MTTVALAFPILGLILLQAAEHNKEPRQRAPTFELWQAAPEPQSPAVPGDKAFGKLFEQQQQQQQQQRAAREALAKETPARRVVCGLVVIQADPNVDPKFVHRAPEDTSGLKIRVIPPASCAD